MSAFIERADLTDLLNERVLMVLRDRLLGMAVDAEQMDQIEQVDFSYSIGWFLLQAERAEILLSIAAIYRAGRRCGYVVPAEDRVKLHDSAVQLMAHLVTQSPMAINALKQWS